jgi:hypothetical protein
MINSNLIFRRQFLLTPIPCKTLSHWQHTDVGSSHLYAHPDVQLSTVTSTDTKVVVVLVGYVIDPTHPERSNANILTTIASLAVSVREVTDYLCSLSGRFVLFLRIANDTLVFHDPCGLRTVYYTRHKGEVFIGSQPYIFKEVIPLKEGERFSSYVKSSYVSTNIEHFIPSGISLFEEVKHLVPNHYLCCSTFSQIRYWPRTVLSTKPVDEVVAGASDLLVRLMIAANNRFKLALPLTAGWDSRMLLCASKGISTDIYFYTLQYRDLHRHSMDIDIPAKLLCSLGLHHNLIDCSHKTISEEFAEIYRQNAPLAHLNDWGDIAFGMFDAYPQDRVAIKGNCSEIARCFYYKYGAHRPIESPDQIVALVNGWDELPFIREQVANWYHSTNQVATLTKIDILDLFYWEHRMGSWQAMSQLEWDVVQEAYTPFNNRRLLELMLSIPTEWRKAAEYKLYKLMFNALWPEVMTQPVNPATIKGQFTNILARMGVYQVAKRIYVNTVR